MNKENELNEKQMSDLLVELTDTQYWQAIIKYLTIRRNIAEDSLKTLDPFKNPTEVARAQGIISGLFDINTFIKYEIENRKKKSNKEEDSE